MTFDEARAKLQAAHRAFQAALAEQEAAGVALHAAVERQKLAVSRANQAWQAKADAQDDVIKLLAVEDIA